MKNKKNTIKSILGCTAAGAAIMLTGAGISNLNNKSYEVYATGVNSIPVSINNSNFNSNTSSSYPFSPNSWSAYVGTNKVSSSSNIKENVTTGVINLTNEKYETKFAGAKRSSLDNYVLMIDSTKEVNGEEMSHDVEYGYRTNSSITLDANSKYMITADVFTLTDSGIASLRLYDNVGEIYASMDNINSHNTWTTHTFFISTNNTKSLNVNLGLYLDGAGIVLFDNISCFKLSDNEYDFTKNSLDDEKFVEKNEMDNVENIIAVNSDGDFVDSSNKYEISNPEYGDNTSYSATQDSDGENEYAIKVVNTKKTYSLFETEDILTIAPNRVYKVNVNVKTKNLDGTASLQLVRTDLDENDKNYNKDLNKTIKITSSSYSTSNSVTNDYKTYSFLINSHSKDTLTFKLKFNLGTTDALTSGEMYISEIEVSKINYETFSSASTGSGVEKLDFVSTYSGSNIYLNNADFNGFKISDYNSPIPATPIDWTVETGKNIQKYGVVNTATFDKDLKDLDLSNLSNPSPSENNNVLMMYNETADTLSYTSASKSLNASSYHHFAIDVQTQNAPITVSLVTKLNDKEVVLSSKTINTYGSWKNIEMFIHTGYQNLDVSLKLTLKTSSYGYAYADNASYNYDYANDTQRKEAFENASESTTTSVVDLENILSNSSNEKFASNILLNKDEDSDIESGIITFNSAYLNEVVHCEETSSDELNNLEKFNLIANGETDKKAIAIVARKDVNYKTTTTVGYSLAKDKYYKFTFDVFTQNIDSNNSEIDKNLLGANIKLSGFDNTFSSIKSNNEWTTYTYYVKVDSDTITYLEFSLGSENAQTKGAAFLTNINFFSDITEDEYNSINENSTVKILKASETKEESTEETPTEETKKEKSDINWWYLVPSILTVLAIFIAIFGFAVRKIKWKNPFKKKSKTTYDRNRTVSIQYYTRKATTLREEKILELNADWKKINDERKTYEDQYKQDLTKLREMKLKRANPSEIAKFEKEMKKNQKLSSNLGITANRIADELKYVKTDMYLNSLIRKLSRESTNKPEQENEEK